MTQLEEEEEGVQVAVKLIKRMTDGGKFDEFLNEIHIMSVLQHPNILHLYGICLKPRFGLDSASSISLFLSFLLLTYTYTYTSTYTYTYTYTSTYTPPNKDTQIDMT